MKKLTRSMKRSLRNYRKEEQASLEEAWNHFNWADEDHIDEAIRKLNNAEILNNNSVCQVKHEYGFHIHKTEIVKMPILDLN